MNEIKINKRVNRVLMSDSYKYSHAMGQYPHNITEMFDYAEARSGKVYPATVFVGLQARLMKFFIEPIEMWEVNEAKLYHKFHGTSFDYEGWMYIVNELGGNLPVTIRAVREGMVIPTGNALFTIKSTDKRVYWIASWLETTLMTVWSMSNVATRSYYVRKMLMKGAELTQDEPNVAFRFHNFGARGSYNPEASQEAGFAHLSAGFMGSDSFSTFKFVEQYYSNLVKQYYSPDGNIDIDMDDYRKNREAFIDTVIESINTTEHSSTASWGKENEMKMIMNHLEINKGQPIIAAVMDTYDYFKCTRKICDQNGEFQKKINTDEYPVFVMRPDSGDPLEIINWTLDMMEEEKVPFTVNKKGYKVFNKMRILWGDGINMNTMEKIEALLIDKGYSTENMAYGSGGWLVQQHDRDTQGWAIKNSQITLDEGSPLDDGTNGSVWEEYLVKRAVFKDPVTDKGKTSKKGELTLWYNHASDNYFTESVQFKSNDFPITDMLNTVYENGKMTKVWNLNELREANA